jgi:hypothetical protein
MNNNKRKIKSLIVFNSVNRYLNNPMKKTIITSAFLLFAQIAIFAQTPVGTTPSDAPAQTPKSEKGRGGERGKGGYQKGKDQKEGKREKQPKMTASDRAVQYSNQLKTSLGLSDDQFQKVLAVNTECITRRDALKGSGDKAAMKTGKADIKAYRLGEFQKIFTADQMIAYQNMNDDKDDKDDKDEKDGDRGNKGKKGKGKGHGKGHDKDSKEEKEDDN